MFWVIHLVLDIKHSVCGSKIFVLGNKTLCTWQKHITPCSWQWDIIFVGCEIFVFGIKTSVCDVIYLFETVWLWDKFLAVRPQVWRCGILAVRHCYCDNEIFIVSSKWSWLWQWNICSWQRDTMFLIV